MAMTVLTKEDCAVYLVEQAAFGTAALDSANGIILDIDTIGIDFDDKVEVTEPAIASRVADKRGYYTHQKRAMPKAEIKGLIHNESIARFMYGLFQNVTEAAGTPFGKTFTWHASQPDFSNDEGYFFTLIVDQTGATCHKVADMIVQSLKFEFPEGEAGKFTAMCVGRGAVATNSNPAGTYSFVNQNLYFHEENDVHTLNFGGGALSPVLSGAWSIEFSQEVLPVGQDGAGSFQNYLIKKKKGLYTAKLLWDSTSRTAFANRASNTMIDGSINWGNATPGTDDLDLSFVFQGKSKPETVQNADDILGVDIQIEILGDKENSEQAVTAVVADAVDMTW